MPVSHIRWLVQWYLPLTDLEKGYTYPENPWSQSKTQKTKQGALNNNKSVNSGRKCHLQNGACKGATSYKRFKPQAANRGKLLEE